MTTRKRSPRTDLLERLLETHERSVSYGRPGPWARDVIVKLDAATFPEAFAPDGRERRLALTAAARDLEADGCVRVVDHARGPLAGEPKEVRLSADTVERAYRVATRDGYEPLSRGLGEIEKRAAALAAEEGPDWMRAFLASLARGAGDADLSLLGMKRERCKREWRDLLPALDAARALARGIAPAWERVVSERVLGDSKALARLRGLVVSILARADPRWDGVSPDEGADLLEAYGVRRKPGLLRCAGAAALRVGERLYRLDDFAPVAHLPDAWGPAWVEGVIEANVRVLTTVENEFPFLSYVEEAGGPCGLGARGEAVVYTAGFPTPALVAALAALAARDPSIVFRHWGDADVGGLRIWWFLRTRLGRAVEILRTTAEWVARESGRGGRPLSSSERAALARFRVELESFGIGGNPDLTGACALVDALLEHGVRIEQERY